MSFGVTMKVTKMFFDRKAVQDMLGKKNAAAMSRALSFIRRRARSSLRRRKGTSAPGSPPSVHSSDDVATLKNILFAFDAASQSGIVGPVKLNQQQYLGGVLQAGTVPELHEFGGTLGLREKLVGKQWRPVGRRKARPGQQTRVRLAKYPARPTMSLALAAESPNITSLWASVNAG